MGKFEKKRKKKSAFRPVLIGIVLAVVLGLLVVLVMPKVLYRLTAAPEETEEVQTEQIVQQETVQSEQTVIENAIPFPVVLEEGMLEVDRLFQFNGMNPDCGNEEEDDNDKWSDSYGLLPWEWDEYHHYYRYLSTIQYKKLLNERYISLLREIEI